MDFYRRDILGSRPQARYTWFAPQGEAASGGAPPPPARPHRLCHPHPHSQRAGTRQERGNAIESGTVGERSGLPLRATTPLSYPPFSPFAGRERRSPTSRELTCLACQLLALKMRADLAPPGPAGRNPLHRKRQSATSVTPIWHADTVAATSETPSSHLPFVLCWHC